MANTLYDTLKDAGVKMSSYNSTLYFAKTEKSTEILKQFPEEKKNSSTFKDNVSGKLWYDVPFAYIPYWKSKIKK